MMKSLISLIFAVFFIGHTWSQNLTSYNNERLILDKRLMLTLGAWSLANAGVSAYGWINTNHESKYFHQMNVMWTGVNLALAVPGYLRAKRNYGHSFTFEETVNAQHKNEKIFLFNAGLDMGYIATGFLLKQRALVDQSNYYRFRGWGNALILQGGFLFLFDLTAALLHQKHRKEKLDPFFDQLSWSDHGVGIKFTFDYRKNHSHSALF